MLEKSFFPTTSGSILIELGTNNSCLRIIQVLQIKDHVLLKGGIIIKKKSAKMWLHHLNIFFLIITRPEKKVF
jgi:hypothetical protein